MPFPNPATQFKPGNPGRPKGRSITDRLRALLEKGEIDGKPIEGGKQIADLITETILSQALKGDYRFVDMILQRLEGPAVASGESKTDADDVGSLRDHLERLKKTSGAPGAGGVLGRASGKRARVPKPRGAS